MRVKDIPENLVLIQDSQDRVAVLESVGLAHLVRERPTPFVEAGNGERKRIWTSSGSCSAWRKRWASSGR
jgi:hypothetical protein